MKITDTHIVLIQKGMANIALGLAGADGKVLETVKCHFEGVKLVVDEHNSVEVIVGGYEKLLAEALKA